MIYGKNNEEKNKLFNYFIDAAKKHDIDVVYIPTKNGTVEEIAQAIPREFEKAKDKFLKDRKHTLIVLEDTGKLFNVNNIEYSSARGSWNTHSNNCGTNGIITLSTANDLANFEESCIRGGRITHKINIDEAVKLSEHPAEN